MTQIDILIYHEKFGFINLEVKNWENDWFEKQGEKAVSEPLKQSVGAIDKLKKYFAEKHGIAEDIPFQSKVVFLNQTDSKISEVTINKENIWGKDVVLNDRKFKEKILHTFNNSNKRIRKDIGHLSGRITSILKNEELFYELDLDAYKESRIEIINATRKLQEKQVSHILKYDNVVVFGEAGTGKTHIALQIAKSLMKSKQKGAYFVYNNLVRKHIEKLMEQYKINPKLMSLYTLQAFLIEKIDYSGVLVNKATLPEKTRNKLVSYFEINEKNKYDFIIIDEMQDVSFEFIKLLRIGLKNEKKGMYLFLDPKQELMLKDLKKFRSESDYFEMIKADIPNIKKYRLKEVVRNSKSIYDDTKEKVPKHWTVGCSNDKGIATEYHTASNFQQLHEITLFFINKLNNAKVKHEDIVVLGNHNIKAFFPRNIRKNTIKKLVDSSGIEFELVESEIASKQKINKIQYGEIGKFKGCESDVIILWWKGKLPQHRAVKGNQLFENQYYIGASRAKLVLCIINFKK
ncbi:AAA family ATPase [Leptospira levettii]|uniref:AAA family ATPase n=1 Tax=Leptospira levettii TaxID=2023178 RepID=A0AAW5V9K4_9LEPT|nr:AAA family ATPase [Leptospira levettii]MCW7512091.1 AAA family ATPase [Leptospira levettii]MCW7517170.1 AAA family ATPase [Leptospira levettii]